MATQKTRRQSDAIDRSKAGQMPALRSRPDGLAGQVEAAWRRFVLRFLHSPWNAPPMAIGVASSVPGEGRTTASVALASCLAHETSASVALLGLDSQGYGLAEAFGIPDSPDVEGVLRGAWTLEAAMTLTSVPGLAVLPASSGLRREKLPQTTYWPALRRRLPDLLRDLRRDFGYVVCDLPPLLGNPDAPDLAEEMDGLVFLTRSGVTPLRRLEEALPLINQEKLAGAVHMGERTTLPKWVDSLLLD